ncbi:hypothetical protein [Clostridium manihotivorum]|nr:hypothetical protein [Clostridium manihotivorum]
MFKNTDEVKFYAVDDILILCLGTLKYEMANNYLNILMQFV